MFKEYIDGFILKDRKRTALFFVVIATVFFIDKLTLGPLSAVQLHDVFETDFPRYVPMGELLFKYGLYFWYPNWPGGAPAFAWHHSPFYILNLVSQVLPLWAIYGGLLIAMMSAAGYGMYRFLSGYTAEWISVIGGVFFALNMQLTNLFVLYTFSYAFPLYFAWRCDLYKGRARILKLIILNLFVALSYPVLTLPYFFILEVLLIALFQPEGLNSKLAMLVRASLTWTGYIVICVPVIYGLYKYIPYSHRTYAYEPASPIGFLKNLHNGFVQPSLTTMTLIPIFGAIAIIDKSDRVRRALATLVAVVLLSAVFGAGVNAIFRGTLLEKMDLGHITVIFPIVMTMTAFIAIDTVIKDQRLVGRFLVGLTAGVLYAIFALLIVKSIETQVAQMLILNVGSGSFIALTVLASVDNERLSLPKPAQNPIVVFVFCCASIAAVFYFNPRKLAQTDLISIAPVAIVSIWAIYWLCDNLLGRSSIFGKRPSIDAIVIMIGVVVFFQVRFTRYFGEESVPYINIFPNLSILKKLKEEGSLNQFRVAAVDLDVHVSDTIAMVQKNGFETPDGRGPLFNKYYREFIGILRAPQLEDFEERYKFNTNWYNLFMYGGNAGFIFYPFSLLNIKYIIVTTNYHRSQSHQTFHDTFKEIYSGSTMDDYKGILKGILSLYSKPFYVLRCSESFERWYLVKKASVLTSDIDVSSAIFESLGEFLPTTVYFSKDEAPQQILTRLNGEISINDKVAATHYSPDEINLDIEVTSPAVLVVSNNYDPNWKAYVDGQATKVLRTNLAFQSIMIEQAGHHRVVLRYQDRAQRYTLILIPIGMLIFNYFIMTGNRKYMT